MDLLSVWNAYEEIQFQGVRLARASTEMKESLRWIEIEIYRTSSGRYVIHRVGVSLVYHVHEGDRCAGKGVPTQYVNLPDDAVPCPECHPVRNREGDCTVDMETDRHTADICTAEDVQSRLMVHPFNGQPFLSAPARKALDQAIAADPTLVAKTKRVRFID